MRDRATAYAERVVSGDVVAGELHVQACRRHLRDLERQGTDEFPYLWVPEKSEEILDFAETLTIVEGDEPRPVRLYGCQTFDLGVPMGWVNRKGYRRFRRKYKSVARQNGKTFENGITATYLAGFGGYRFGKLFTVATKKRQARLAWEDVERFVLADGDLMECFRIQDYKSLITSWETGCTIEALSREGGLDEGFRSIYASIDEIHQHRDNKIYKAIYNGQRSLKEALTSMITTRGDELNSFCYEMDEYCQAILAGGSTAENFFVDIYCLDDGDDLFAPEHFPKSNPVLCQTEEGMETMLADAQTARDAGGRELADYITKCQNMWSENADEKLVTPAILKKCRSPLTLEHFRGASCFAGLDLSSGGDLTTLALEFQWTERERPMYYGWSVSFMPRGRLEEHIRSDLAPYDVWAHDRLLLATGSVQDFKNDYSFILATLRDTLAEYDLTLLGLGYDPHNADCFLKDLEELGAPLLEVKQSARFLHSGTEELQLLMKSGQYLYDQRNELLDLSFRNARIVRNSFKEMKVDKEAGKRTRRIDPVDAAIDAHVARMKLTEDPGGSGAGHGGVSDKNGVEYVNYIKELLRWAEPGYRWTLETAGELALLAGRGCRWLGRFLLALLLFLPWLVVGLVLWAQRRRGEGGE